MSEGYNASCRLFLTQKIFLVQWKTEISLKEKVSQTSLMVETKKLLLDLQIEIDVPMDIVQDKWRIKAVEEGLARSVSKGLYDQGVSFRISKVSSKIY
jgi:hypothetical protein